MLSLHNQFKFEETLLSDSLRKNNKLKDNLSNQMEIKIDNYLNAIPSSVEFNKESLISILDYSPNFKYNSLLDSIQLRTSPLRNILKIQLTLNTKQELVPSKEELEEITHEFNKNISFLSYNKNDNKEAIIEFDLENICLGVEKKLSSLSISSSIETENVKDKILNNTHTLFKVTKHHIPRKLSENNHGLDGNKGKQNYNYRGNTTHKGSVSIQNKFDLINQNFSSYRKKSYNKFDSYQVISPSVNLSKNFELKNLPKESYYNFKELSGLYWNMKLLKKFDKIPEEIVKLEIEGVFSDRPRENLDHFKTETNKMYRERANTELFQFKSKFIY